MRLYEFRCPSCQRTVEAFVYSDPGMPKGAICGPCGESMARVITAPAIRGETVAKS